jgi:hypothetical protein
MDKERTPFYLLITANFDAVLENFEKKLGEKH